MLKVEYFYGAPAPSRLTSGRRELRDFENSRQRMREKSFANLRSSPNVEILNSVPVVRDRKRAKGVTVEVRPGAKYQRIDYEPFHVPEPKPVIEETPLVELRQINPMEDMTAEPARMLNEIVVKTKRGVRAVPRLDAFKYKNRICASPDYEELIEEVT